MKTFSRAFFSLNFVLTLTFMAVTLANASPPDDTQAIEYIGLNEFSDVASLSNIPKNLREKKIDSLRNEFSTRLSENRALVSDVLVLLLEVILLDQKQSAQALARRYARTGLPSSIRHLVNFKTAKIISDSSAQSTQGSHGNAGVVIRLHPLWFNDSQCRVAISGRIVTATETPAVSPGESFYAQRICDNPAGNRLAQGVAPNGKETLYIGFREAPEGTNNETIDNEQRAAQSKTSLGLSSMSPSPIHGSALRPNGIGILSGIGRARLGSAGQRPTNAAIPGAPFVIHGLRIFVGDAWAVLVQGSNVGLPKNNNTIIPESSESGAADTDQNAKTGLEKRFLSRISLEYGKNFGPAVAQVRPTLGVGITSLSRGTHSFNNPQYLAPHCGIGLELSSSPFSRDFTFSLRPTVSLAPPPFSGVSAELLLGMSLVL
jgi:hypothetical protein